MDAEVTTLQDADNYISSKNLLGVRSILVLLTGNVGPCDGCKARIMEFLRRVQKQAPNVHVRVEANYTTASRQETRQQQTTRYGYSDAQTQHSLVGQRYYFKT